MNAVRSENRRVILGLILRRLCSRGSGRHGGRETGRRGEENKCVGLPRVPLRQLRGCC